MTDTLSLGIIIPVYNAERFLAEALESCLDQTRPADEIIIVDDGSTDASMDIAQQFSRKHQGSIRIHQLPANAGEGAARAAGMEMATSDILIWADADDIQHPTRVQSLATRFTADPALDICMNSGELIDAEGQKIDRPLEWPETFGTHPLLWELSRNYFLGGFSACRRDIGIPFSREHRYSPDYDFFLRALLAEKRFLFLDTPLTAYRIHGSNQSYNSQGMRDATAKTLAHIVPEKAKALLLAQGCREADILLHLGENLLMQEKPEDALAYLAAAGATSDADTFKLDFYFGTAYYLTGDLRSSLEHLQQAHDMRPDDATTLNNLAVLRAAFHDHDASLHLLRRAVQIRPNYADAQNNLAALRENGSALRFTQKLLRTSWFSI